jgi:hypothetical protein
MLGLRDKLRDAPFLRENGLDAGEFLISNQPFQDELDLAPKQAAVQRQSRFEQGRSHTPTLGADRPVQEGDHALE